MSRQKPTADELATVAAVIFFLALLLVVTAAYHEGKRTADRWYAAHPQILLERSCP